MPLKYLLKKKLYAFCSCFIQMHNKLNLRIVKTLKTLFKSISFRMPNEVQTQNALSQSLVLSNTIL
jgi:hypothetical protein